MKIRIVSYEDLDGWICGKIARRLTEALQELGYDCSVGKTADLTADINHHIIYLNYPGHTTGRHTLMVTHVDDALKFKKLQRGLETAEGAICVSSDGLKQLIGLGVSAADATYVNLAHDSKARPRRIVIGITTRLYPDGRKKEDSILKLIETISPDDFAFKIMGFGWQSIVDRMRALGFQVEFYDTFEYETYLTLMASLDYFVYLGEDEGSMGFIDALAAGVKTIVHPQGHHLDAKNGITFPVTNYAELKQAFATIAAERHQLTGAVADWTWINYANRHVAIWNRCLAGQPVGQTDASQPAPSRAGRWQGIAGLYAKLFVRKGTMVMNLGKDYECGSRWWSRKKRPATPAVSATPPRPES